MHPSGRRGPTNGCRSNREGATSMADLAYALLLIGVFALLALGVRGLGRL
ncbi:hypothetical protein [Saccharothrix yanglingensis]|nr:hypothetical protein [Saccharothrix yanglingensis]